MGQWQAIRLGVDRTPYGKLALARRFALFLMLCGLRSDEPFFFATVSEL
jgi:hypothetical protein